MSIFYFDNAASSRRPRKFVEEYLKLFGKERTFEEEKEVLERISLKISGMLGVSPETISFVPNATYALNEIAIYLSKNGSIENPIYLSSSEHSSNNLIWLKLSKNPIHYFELEEFKSLIIPEEKAIFSFSSVSNLEGIEVSIEDIDNKFRKSNSICVVDASQMLQHKIPKLENSCIDYLVFTAHKFFGPNGIGVIYSKEKTGLGINSFNYSERYKNYSLDFTGLEAWSNSIDEIIDLFNSGAVAKKEKELNKFFLDNFPDNPFIEVVNRDTKGCIFLLKIVSDEFSAHDFAFFLAREGIITRAGVSCSWLSADKFDSHRVLRVSLGVFNDREEIEFLFEKIKKFVPINCL